MAGPLVPVAVTSSRATDRPTVTTHYPLSVARPSITEERRRQILEAAAGVIAERGLCEARISDIATRIGASPALILYYFPSKDALLAEALAFRDQLFFDGVEQGMEDGAGAAARLGQLIEASCPPSEPLDRPDNEWLLWLDVWTRSRHDADLSAQRARLDDQMRVDDRRDSQRRNQVRRVPEGRPGSFRGHAFGFDRRSGDTGAPAGPGGFGVDDARSVPRHRGLATWARP